MREITGWVVMWLYQDDGAEPMPLLQTVHYTRKGAMARWTREKGESEVDAQIAAEERFARLEGEYEVRPCRVVIEPNAPEAM